MTFSVHWYFKEEEEECWLYNIDMKKTDWYMVMCFLQVIMLQRPVWFVENVSSLKKLWVHPSIPSVHGGVCFPQLVSLLLQGMETLLLLCWLIWISLLLRNRCWQWLLWDMSFIVVLPFSVILWFSFLFYLCAGYMNKKLSHCLLFSFVKRLYPVVKGAVM